MKKKVPDSRISSSTPPITIREKVIPTIRTSDHAQVVKNLISNGDLKNLKVVLSHYGYGNDFSDLEYGGGTPLHEAAKYGSVEIMQTLLSLGKIDVNKLEEQRQGGFAAIHHSVKENHPDLLILLLHNGADPNLKTRCSFGDTALHLACKFGRGQCAEILTKRGADPNARDNLGNNPSFWAYSRHYEYLIRDLALPPPSSPSPLDFFKYMMHSKNTTNTLPSIKIKNKKQISKKKK